MGGLRSDAVSPVPYRGAMKVLPVALVALAIALAPLSSAGISAPADVQSAVEGREELARLGCAACHDALEPAGQRLAPDLGLSAGRLRGDFLLRYLEAPAEAQPGTRMPDLMGDRSAAERADVARALAAFLASEAVDGAGAPSQAAGDAVRGQRVYHEVGCVMCHGARDGAGTALPEGGQQELATVVGVVAILAASVARGRVDACLGGRREHPTHLKYSSTGFASQTVGGGFPRLA